MDTNDIILKHREKILLSNNVLNIDNFDFLQKLKFIEDVGTRAVKYKKNLYFMEQIYKMMFLDVMRQQLL